MPTNVTDYSTNTYAALLKGDEPLVSGTSIEHFEDGVGKLKFTIDCSLDGPMIGKSIRALVENTKSLYINFPARLLPTGSEIESGSVTLIVNNQKSTELKIPKYLVTDNVGASASASSDGEGKMRTVLSLSSSSDQLILRELITPPSAESIPDKAASPH